MTETSITPEIVRRVANLARLELTEEELTNATTQLNNILGNFSAIQSVDTNNIPPADRVSGLQNVARSDQAKADHLCSTDELLARPSAIEQRHIKVEAVFSDI